MPLCGFLTFQCDLPSAGPQPMCHTAGGRSLCGIYGRCSAIHAVYTAGVPQSMRPFGRVSAIYIMQQYILQKYTKFRLIHFGSVSNCRYRSIQTQVSFFQHSTIAALYKKAQGCAEGRGLVPLCGFLTFQCDLPSAGPQPMCHTAGGRSLCGYTTGVPQSMRHIRPGFRNPCGHSAGASAALAVIISPYKI